jgi:hypothetical protein
MTPPSAARPQDHDRTGRWHVPTPLTCANAPTWNAVLEWPRREERDQMPEQPPTRRLTLQLPADLVDWLQGFAEISHRTVEDVVRPLVEAERTRVEENWE